MLKLSLETNVEYGQKFEQDLSQLSDEKEITLFFKESGGKDLVQSFINLYQWWNQLSEDLKNKLLGLPFRFVKENLWFVLPRFSIEQLNQWCDDIISRSQEQYQKNGRKLLSPSIWKKVATNILPKPKPNKSYLELHQPVLEADFNVLLKSKKYGFTVETLEQFKAKVVKDAKGQPILTEDLFPFLSARKLDPLLIVSKNDRIRFEFEQKLQEKEKELENVRSQLSQQLQQRDQRIEQLEQQNQQQQVQINQLTEQNRQVFEQMQEFKQFMESSKAAA